MKIKNETNSFDDWPGRPQDNKNGMGNLRFTKFKIAKLKVFKSFNFIFSMRLRDNLFKPDGVLYATLTIDSAHY